nr:YhgE/Pip domain-containing protein [Lactiplantibacillus plantarum]
MQKLQTQLKQPTNNQATISATVAALKKQAAGTDLSSVKTALSALTSAIKTSAALHDNVAATANSQNLTAAQKSAILATVDQSANRDAINAALASLTTAIAQSTQPAVDTTALTRALSATTQQQADLVSTVTQLTTGAQSLTTGIQSAGNAANKLRTSLTQLNTVLPNLTNGIGAVTTGATNLASGTTTLTTNSQQLTQGFKTLDANTNLLNQRSHQLATGAGQVAAGSQQLTAGTRQLSTQGNQLTQGASRVATGLQSAQTNLPSLTTGISQLVTGSQQVTTGLHRLGTTGIALANGSQQLTSGNGQLATGAQQLAVGANQVTAAGNKIQTGNQALASKLGTAASKGNLNPSKLTYQQVAKPVTTTHQDRDDVPNNGTGMAPYMLSVSLFVGALALNMMFDMYTPRKHPQSALDWWSSKASIMLVFSIMESTIMLGLMMLINGLSPIHPFATWLLLTLTALLFMTIVAWLNLVFGKAGAFFSMVLLVLQLGGSAGTYPIQLSGHFFQTIHPWLPMSYSVNGLRQTLMTGNSALPEMGVLALILMLFIALTWLFFIRRYPRLAQIDFEDPVAVKATQSKLATLVRRKAQAKASDNKTN